MTSSHFSSDGLILIVPYKVADGCADGYALFVTTSGVQLRQFRADSPMFLRYRPIVGNPGTFLLFTIHKVTSSDGCNFGIDSKIDKCASPNLGTSHDRAKDL